MNFFILGEFPELPEISYSQTIHACAVMSSWNSCIANEGDLSKKQIADRI